MISATRGLAAIVIALAFSGANANASPWQPAPGHTQTPIWPRSAPDARRAAGPENAITAGKASLVAGRPWLQVRDVSRPTMTVYQPKAKNTGGAVVVFPGGGYQVLAVDLEGTEVCDWLTSAGITCVLLKYRVSQSGPYWDARCRCHVTPPAPTALEDAQRTLRLVRFHAAEWHVDAHKIGVLGFSAGGHLVAAISTHFERRLYPAVDAPTRQAAARISPWRCIRGISGSTTSILRSNRDIRVTRETPPTFLLQAEDDNVDGVNQSLVYCVALKDAGVPVEMHLYAQGGTRSAFGRRIFRSPEWPRLVEIWLKTINMTSSGR